MGRRFRLLWTGFFPIGKSDVRSCGREAPIKAVLACGREASVREPKTECAHWRGQARFEGSMRRPAPAGLVELIGVPLALFFKGFSSNRWQNLSSCLTLRAGSVCYCLVSK